MKRPEDKTTVESDKPDDPRRFGAYRLERKIEEGGFGVVFQAVAVQDVGDVAAGTTVALKRLRPDAKGKEDARERFLREVELGLTVRHPALVSFLDSGRAVDADGEVHDYFAMEYIEGERTLDSWLASGPPLSEPHLRRVALQLASALDALHSAGVVHRDVKPQNVLVTPDNDVKLADLGIAHLMTPDRWMTESGVFIGSTPYSAPEQFDEPWAKPPADLYSLGVLLYEAATGQCPFRGASYNDVAQLHRNYVPPKVGRLRGQLSLFFEELVTTLLQKEPKRRFPSAGVLADILEQGEGSRWWQERAPDVDLTGRRSVARRLRVRVQPDERFVGRDRELGALLAAEQDLVRGRGGAFLIEGEPGLGKTRLLGEFIDKTDDRPTQVLLGSYRAGAGTQEAQGLREALVHRIGLPRLSAELGRYLPDSPWQAELLERHLRGEPPPLEDQHSPLPALHAAARAVLRAMAREQPLILILENLHQLGEDKAPLLEPLLQLAAEEPILLLLTRRSGGEGQDALLEPVARGLARKLDLGALHRDQVEALLTRILRSRSRAADQALGIARRTRGNPFFVIAIARNMAAREEESKPSQGDGATLPASLADLLLERVKLLDADSASLLRAAAVLGHRFDPFQLAAVVERDELVVIETLERLERAGGLVRSMGARFEFEHDLLREAIEGALPEALSRTLHGRIAAVHAEARGLAIDEGTDEPTEDALFLAHHLLHSREPETGIPWTVAALEQLYRRARTDELLALAKLAVDVGDLADACTRARIRLHQGNCLEILGRRDAQHGCARAALKNAEDCGDEALQIHALLQLAYALDQRGQRERGGELSEQALERARELGESKPLCRALVRVARHRVLTGRHDEALALLSEAILLADELGNATLQARNFIILGLAQLDLGETESARESLTEARQLARRAADPRSEVSAFGNLCRTYLRIGELDAAESHLEEHVTVSRELGFAQGRIVASLNLAGLHLLRGNIERVRDLAAEARELDASPSAFHTLAATLRLAEADLAEGHLATAVGNIDGARRRSPEPEPFLASLFKDLDLQVALLEARSDEVRTLLLELEPVAGGTRADPELRVEYLLRRAELAGLERDEAAHAEFVDEALDLARELHALRGLASALLFKGRLLVCSGQLDSAAPFLREAAELVERLRVVQPGPLPLAYLALLRDLDPDTVDVPASCPPLVRAEALHVLHRAGAKGEPLAEAKVQLDRLCEHLPQSDRDRFWITQPVARDVLESLRRGGR